jgi:hypothetical protein
MPMRMPRAATDTSANDAAFSAAHKRDEFGNLALS